LWGDGQEDALRLILTGLTSSQTPLNSIQHKPLIAQFPSNKKCAKKILTHFLLEVTEKFRPDEDTDSQLRVKFVVLQQAFTITVIILQEQKLIILARDAISKINDGVIVQVPTATLHQSNATAEALVA
jgi:hypothetical protein